MELIHTNNYSDLFDIDKVSQSVSTSFENNGFGYRITGVSPEKNNWEDKLFIKYDRQKCWKNCFLGVAEDFRDIKGLQYQIKSFCKDSSTFYSPIGQGTMILVYRKAFLLKG